MPAFTEDSQRFGSADGLWLDDNVDAPNDGVDGSILHRQVLVSPPAASATAIVSALAVNLQPGDEVIIPFVGGSPVEVANPRVFVIKFTPATTDLFADNFTWFGVDGYGRTDEILEPNTLLGATGIVSAVAYRRLTKIRWNGPNPYVGALDIGFNDFFGFRFPIVSASDVLTELVSGTPTTVPIPVTGSSIFVGPYEIPGGRGLWSPTNPVPDGVRTYYFTYRPAKVETVHTVQEVTDIATANAVFTADLIKKN